MIGNFGYFLLIRDWTRRAFLDRTSQMHNDGLFGASVMSQRERRSTRQLFVQTGEFGVHFLMTSQYSHLISRRFLLAADNAMDVFCDLNQFHVKFPII